MLIVVLLLHKNKQLLYR